MPTARRSYSGGFALLPVSLLMTLFTAALPAQQAVPKPKPNSEVLPLKLLVPIPGDRLREFNDRVKQYAQLVKDQKAKIHLTPLKTDNADSHTITAYKRSLAGAIRSARAGAKQGDIFFPEIQEDFRRSIRSELKGIGARDSRLTINEDKASAMALKVNADYPETEPLGTLPPMVLAKLPPLPEQLDYRFVRQSLVLRDTEAGIIVDVLPAVLVTAAQPAATAAKAAAKANERK